jgi:hypothetical protein
MGDGLVARLGLDTSDDIHTNHGQANSTVISSTPEDRVSWNNPVVMMPIPVM